MRIRQRAFSLFLFLFLVLSFLFFSCPLPPSLFVIPPSLCPTWRCSLGPSCHDPFPAFLPSFSRQSSYDHNSLPTHSPLGHPHSHSLSLPFSLYYYALIPSLIHFIHSLHSFSHFTVLLHLASFRTAAAISSLSTNVNTHESAAATTSQGALPFCFSPPLCLFVSQEGLFSSLLLQSAFVFCCSYHTHFLKRPLSPTDSTATVIIPSIPYLSTIPPPPLSLSRRRWSLLFLLLFCCSLIFLREIKINGGCPFFFLVTLEK